MKINADKMNLTELKALAYDIIAQIEGGQSSLTAINKLIKTKTESEAEEKDAKPKS